MARATCDRLECRYEQTVHDTTGRYRRSRGQILSYSMATILFILSTLLVETKAQTQDENFQFIERRSLSLAPAPSGYQATYEPPGGRTQLSIGLARVKNPDEEEESYDGKGYMKKRKKKKKFPITWLRNQYPFNSYYNRKKRPQQPAASSYPADLSGQYSSQSYDVMDPNPSTWVRIPSRPTASIKIHKQSQLPIGPADINAFQANPYGLAPPLPPPMSLMPQPNSELDSFPIHPMRLQQSANPQSAQASIRPAQPVSLQMSGGEPSRANALMTSESQDSYSSQSGSAPGRVAAVAAGAASAGESAGFGGISLSFGNGRSISFGGGKGLTIGGKAGAIEIGRNAGGISIGSGGSDNQPAASGYSETKGAAASSYGHQAAGYSSSAYGNDYVNKHPIMSVDVPRRGKKLVHANLDQAPVKFRLHSSPRVKITTGSRDPLEKPSDEELTEEEEDIFEPPVPFPKKNATMNETEGALGNGTNAINGTSGSANMSNTNGTEPMQLYQLQQNSYDYQQQKQQQFNQQHERFSHYQHVEQQPDRHQYPAKGQHSEQHFNGYPGQAHAYHDEHLRSVHTPAGAGGFTPHSGHRPPAGLHGPPSHHNQNVPFDEPPHYVQQAAVVMPPSKRPPTNESTEMMPQPKAPPMNQLGQTLAQAEAPMPQVAQMNGAGRFTMPQAGDDQRPAVNQWRQFSREARPHMNQQVPKQENHLAPDQNAIFYNGGHPNSIAGPSTAEARDSVDVAASSQNRAYAKTSSPLATTQARFTQPVASDFSHKQFNPTTVYQVVPPRKPPQQQMTIKSAERTQQKFDTILAASQPPAPVQEGANQPMQQPLQPEGSYQAPRMAYSAAQAGYQHPQHPQHPQNLQQKTGHQGQQSYQRHESEQGYKTYTIGSGGISTEYGSGGAGYSSGGSSYGQGYGHGGGVLVSSDGFDRKHYDAKVEKFDPEAHDKREKSKVILFLRPRISIHSANSSTTTRRPKNQQRLVHVINRPIFLNNITMTNGTNTTHHDEEFLDPDLAEPMDVYQYGYGYGHGYTKGYRISTTSTTKKPKRRTTTTTTTAAPTTSSETESTTTTTTAPSSSSGETEGTTTPASSTSSGGEDSSSTSTTEASSASTSEPSSTSTAEPSTTTNTTESGSSDEVETSSSTTSSSVGSTDQNNEDGGAEELVSSATEEVPVVTVATSAAPPSTTTTTTTTATSTTKAIRTTTSPPVAKTPIAQRVKPTTTTTTTTTSTTTTTTTTTPEPPTTTTTESPPSSTTGEPVITSTEATTTTTTEAPTTTSPTITPTSFSVEPTTTPEPTTTATSTSRIEEEFTTNAVSTEAPTTTEATETFGRPDNGFEGQKDQQSRRSLRSSSSSSSSSLASKPLASRSLNQKVEDRHQPMLLNDDLIEKLMRNKTLVALMSSQLKRVIPSEKLDESEKQHIVRQVFVQMMEKKVDFSMNNVRLAVKTVSSSYKAAAEKSQRAKSKTSEPVGELPTSSPSDERATNTSKRQSRRRNVDPKGPFGLKAPAISDQKSSDSKSAPVIDTALKLTTRRHVAPTSRRDSRTSASASRQKDSNGNPIVVVLLPTEKAK